MKALFLLLLSGVSVSASAQHTDSERKQITEKNLRLFATQVLPSLREESPARTIARAAT